MNTSDLINKLALIDAQPVQRLTTKMNALTTTKTAWQMATAQLVALQINSYTLSKESTYQVKSVSSSNQDAITASAGSNAALGAYDLQVLQLASSHQMISQGYADIDTTAIGAGTMTFEQSGGYISPFSRTSELNGYTGISRGSIRIIDRAGNDTTLDLSKSVTTQDIVDAINNNTDVNVVARINASGNGINIQDKSGSTANNLYIYDLSGGQTAQDLGISTGTGGVSRSYVLGSSIMKMTSAMTVSALNDGNGIRESERFAVDFTIASRDGVSTKTVEVANQSTVQDYLTAMTSAGKFTASLNASGTAFVIKDVSGGVANDLFVYHNTVTRDLDADIAAGNSVVRIDSAADYKIGDQIQFYDTTTKNLEFHTIQGIDYSTGDVTLDSELQYAYVQADTMVANANSIHDLGLDFSRNDASPSSVKEGRQIINGINTFLTKHLNGGSGYAFGSVQITDKNGIAAIADLSSEIASTISSDSTGTTLTVADGKDFRAGDQIRIVNGSTIETRNILRIESTTGTADTIILDSAITGTASTGAKVYTRLDTTQQVIDRLNTAQHATAISAINGAVSAGASAVTVDNGALFTAGQRIAFMENNTIEYKTIASINANELTFTEALEYGHSNNLTIWTTTDTTASDNSAGNGIKITDNTGGSNDLIVAEVSGGTTADTLGILNAGTSDTVIEGSDLNHQWISEKTQLSGLNFGSGIFEGKFKITAHSGTSYTVDLSSTINAKTIGDVLIAINSNTIGVKANINTTGDGILLTDSSTGSSLLKVEEVSGGSTAKSLNLLANTSSTTVDGKFAHSVELAATDTLEDVISKINSEDIGISAAIINDGALNSPYRMMLTSEHSGSIGRMVIDTSSLSGGSGLSLSSTASARDTALLIGKNDGSSRAQLIIKNSNTVTDAIQGVTLNLLQETTAPVKLSITENYTGIIKAVQDFATQFNTSYKYLKDLTSYDDTTKQKGKLLGDSTILTIQDQINDILTSSVTGLDSDMCTFSQVGVSMGQDNLLTVNTSKLETALRTSLEKVKKVFTFQENVALSSNLSEVTVSSEDDAVTSPSSKVNDGNNSPNDGAWISKTTALDSAPSISLNFTQAFNLSKIKIFMMDTVSQPAESYALGVYNLQTMNSAGTWSTQASAYANIQGTLTHVFDRAIHTSSIRLTGIVSNATDTKSRVVEIEAYENRGIATRLNDLLTQLTARDGVIQDKETAIDDTVTTLKKRIDDMNAMLQIRKNRNIQKFAAMETAVNNMQNQSSWMQSQMSSLTSSNK